MRTATVEAIRELERRSIAAGTPEYTLMLRAGQGAAAWLAHRRPDAAGFVFLAGGGNNGGDALVAARELSRRFPVRVFGVRPLAEYRGSAARAAADLPPEIPFFIGETPDFRPGEVIVDGLLGIGFTGGALRPETARLIAAANASGAPIVALDLPSGINGDTGAASPDGAIRAAATLTFGAPKPGLFRGAGAELRGRLRVIDIGLGASDAADMEVFTNSDAVRLVPRWPVDTHKNRRGRVLVWAGSPEYPGAGALTVRGAMYGGAGMVRAASEAALDLPHGAIFCRLRPGETPESRFDLADVLVCGCGWGACGTKENLAAAWRFPGILVLDADALNTLARHPEVFCPRPGLIVTPHPGEAARLAAAFALPETETREALAAALARRLRAGVVLKGWNTVVAAPDGAFRIVAAGGPELAVAGSGDVLAGAIGALAAQLPDDPPIAAALGAYVHGIAGENAPGTLISDELPRQIGMTLRDLRENRVF